MRRILVIVLALFLFAVPTLVSAQQAGDNVNVLPVVLPFDGELDPVEDWYLKGDGYLQRQVEPTIAAKTTRETRIDPKAPMKLGIFYGHKPASAELKKNLKKLPRVGNAKPKKRR